jgi:hypothetical protein
MREPRHTFTALFVGLALVVAVFTAVEILTLPSAGTVRYSADNPRSAVAQLRSSLQAVGISQPSGTIQNLLRTRSNPLSFRAATYWTASDVASRRYDYLAAGGLLVLTLLFSAFVLERRAYD